MKASEVNIDVGKLQKLFKEKQKKELQEEEQEQKKNNLPQIRRKEEMKQLSQKISMQMQRLKTIKEKNGNIISDSLLSEIQEIQEQISHPALENSKENTYDSLPDQINDSVNFNHDLLNHSQSAMLLQGLDESLIETILEQEISAKDKVMQNIKTSLMTYSRQQQRNHMPKKNKILAEKPPRFQFFGIKPKIDTKSHKNSIAKSPDDSGFFLTHTNFNDTDHFKSKENTVQEVEDKPLTKNDIFFAAFEQSILQNRNQSVLKKQPFQFQLTAAPFTTQLSLNDSNFHQLKKHIQKSSFTPRQSYHYYQKPKDLYINAKDDLRKELLKGRKRQRSVNDSERRNKDTSQDHKELKNIQRKIKRLIWDSQGSSGNDQSFLSVSKSMENTSHESIKIQYFLNKIQFPPLSDRKMLRPLYRMVDEKVQIPKEDLHPVKRRVRRHTIHPLQTHLLSDDIPIVNYEASILFTKQFSIIYEEVESLQKQVYNLLSLFYIRQKYDFVSVCKQMSLRQQININMTLEMIIALCLNIVKKLLNKYGDQPELIGVTDANYLLEVDVTVEDEQDALAQNMKSMKKTGQSLYEAQEAYMLMYKIYQSENAVMSLPILHELVERIVRARLCIVEVIEQYKLYSDKIDLQDNLQQKVVDHIQSISKGGAESQQNRLKQITQQITKDRSAQKKRLIPKLPNETRDLIRKKSMRIIPRAENTRSQQAKIIQLTQLSGEKRDEEKFLNRVGNQSHRDNFLTQRKTEEQDSILNY
ncbi:UNKNOWN [Stylonychia lemnae]|uniref:Uncharacterized protein n=1 Tax=Stylonychia lemnae TaxID=5949 RepID=A0A078A174_STYLE|nr:UNKNOWN [Stylonychia lemnae]|eukprot:CDW75238.1 UNKNOWN [Stylonychia lemnae]